MSDASLVNVTKRYGRATALAGVSFSACRGDVVALLGANGAGKSTALALLLGLRRPDSGSARLFGGDPRRAESRRDVGVALQESAFPATLRVGELLELARAHYPSPASLDSLLERFGLAAHAGRQLGGLSGGERRRVAVALAFAGRAALVVLDEPTAGLDVIARRQVWSAIRAHAAGGGTVLLTTHYLEEADALASHVVLLDAGVVVTDGDIAEIRNAAGLTRVSFRGTDGERVCSLVEDATAEIARLLREGVSLAGLEVRPLTLEEAISVRRSTS